MTCTQVQRTLVKSPPELWAELSDPDALARHLADLGEVRIMSVEPESAVRWEATDATGCIEIKPSAWGTKVTISVTPKASEAQPPSAPAPASVPEPDRERAEILRRAVELEPAGAAAPPPVVKRTPAIAPSGPAETRSRPEIRPATAWARKQPPAWDRTTPPASARPASRPEDADEVVSDPPASVPAAPEPTRRGFFSRLFGRRNPVPAPQGPEPTGPGLREEPHTETTPAKPDPQSALEALQARFAKVESAGVDVGEKPAPVEPPVLEPPAPATEAPAAPVAEEPPAAAASTAVPPAVGAMPGPDGSSGLSAELRAAEELGPDEVRTILTGMLDRLGAAHHRPFSRA